MEAPLNVKPSLACRACPAAFGDPNDPVYPPSPICIAPIELEYLGSCNKVPRMPVRYLDGRGICLSSSSTSFIGVTWPDRRVAVSKWDKSSGFGCALMV